MATRASAGSDPLATTSAAPGSWLLWAALAVAFSPVALDLVRHAIATPWALYALVFPPLFVRLGLRDARREPAAIGTLWIAAAIALEIACAFLGALRWARPGAAIAAIGMCQRLGVASWPSRALLLFAVPVPAFLVRPGERGIASAIGEAVAALWSALGDPVSLVGSAIQRGPDALVLLNRDWLALVPLLVGLAWYDAALLRRSLPGALVGCAAAAALALPVQTSALAAAVALAAWGAPGPAQALVDHVWLGVAAAGVALAELRLRRAGGKSR